MKYSSSTKFRPFPFLGNPHVQTILGSALKGYTTDLPHEVIQLPLADGDTLLLYDSQSGTWEPGKPIAVLVHGLTGCHTSGYMIRLGKRLVANGYRVVRMDLRGAGPSIRLARKFYNAACSADVREVLRYYNRQFPSSPIVLVGFSLGGNIVLKLAGEEAGNPIANLVAIATAAPPIDLKVCSILLAQPKNLFYDRYFAKALVGAVEEHYRLFPDQEKIDFPSKLTLREFDDLYTAPRGGFADVEDYYEKAACLPLIEQIKIPTLIFTAKDDPFIALEPIRKLQGQTNIEVRVVDRGGHLGFLGPDGNGGVRWLEPRMAEWILQNVQPI